MDNPRLVYVPRQDATLEGELAALAAVYAFVIQAHEQNKSAAPVTPLRSQLRAFNREEVDQR